MGKFKKNKTNKSKRHSPLDQQILENRYAQPSSRNKIRRKQLKDQEFVDNKLTSEILKQARLQQEDLEEEVGVSLSETKVQTSLGTNDESDYDKSFTVEPVPESITIDEDDEKALNSFMSKDSEKRATLADIIKEKLTEKQTEICTIYSDVGTVIDDECDSTRIEAFKALVPVLQNYRSGRLPTLFKVIPKFRNWEHILYLTEPDKWSAAAMFQATRIFSSNLEDRMAQRFYNLILLPRLRDDIAECKKLNDHLYRALEKALFKAGAFFKGIIIPLCNSGNCTYREATIFGSVIAKCSVPVLHSCAALLTIAEMDYFGVGSIFMRILLEKKYALPFRVVNAVADHFIRFIDDTRQFPLLWHQCLLTYVQLYKADLSEEQKNSLLKLINIHHHEHVTPEIRKELQQKKDISDCLQTWKL